MAKSNVEAARLNLEFTKIRSPVDGKTGPILVQPGNMVIGQPPRRRLVTIDQIQPIKVSFALPQTDLPRIQARQRRRRPGRHGQFARRGGKQLSAPVDFVSNAVNNVTGTIELRSTFKNEDKALVPGQLVNVTVQLDDIPGAMVVPHEAVNIGPDGNYVYRAQGRQGGHRSRSRCCSTTAQHGGQGRSQWPANKVVTDGQLRVVPGATVAGRGRRCPSARRRRDAAARKRPAGGNSRHEHLAAALSNIR